MNSGAPNFQCHVGDLPMGVTGVTMHGCSPPTRGRLLAPVSGGRPPTGGRWQGPCVKFSWLAG